MLGYELIKETFIRKSYIPAMHGISALFHLFLFQLAAEEGFASGKLIFITVGLIFPTVISAGIFGDDISSGRMVVLMTKPIRFSELYLWRFLGLLVQGVVQLSLCGILVVVTDYLTGNGSSAYLLRWLFLSLLLFATVASLSTTISVFAKRGYNFMVLTIGIFLILAVRVNLSMLGDAAVTVYERIAKYLLPPVEVLYTSGAPAADWSRQLGAILWAMTLVVIYAGIGIFILSRREFKRETD